MKKNGRLVMYFRNTRVRLSTPLTPNDITPTKMFIVYLEVTGPLRDRLDSFFKESKLIGISEALQYHPHCSVSGFFEWPIDKQDELISIFHRTIEHYMPAGAASASGASLSAPAPSIVPSPIRGSTVIGWNDPPTVAGKPLPKIGALVCSDSNDTSKMYSNSMQSNSDSSLYSLGYAQQNSSSSASAYTPGSMSPISVNSSMQSRPSSSASSIACSAASSGSSLLGSSCPTVRISLKAPKWMFQFASSLKTALRSHTNLRIKPIDHISLAYVSSYPLLQQDGSKFYFSSFKVGHERTSTQTAERDSFLYDPQQFYELGKLIDLNLAHEWELVLYHQVESDFVFEPHKFTPIYRRKL